MDERYIPIVDDLLDSVENNLKTRQVVIEKYNNYVTENNWLSVVFSVAVGATFEDYLIGRVISDSAKELLKLDRSVTEIAKEYGFNSQQTYSTTFADVVGVPPHIYRANRGMGKLVEKVILEKASWNRFSTKNVKIEKIEPMTVASIYLYKSNSRQSKIKVTREIIEPKAWSKLIRWQMIFAYYHLMRNEGKNPGISKLSKMMVEGGYHLAPNSRFFGFATTFNSAEVDYEAWSMMNYPNHEIVSDDKDVVIKHFDGGLYATVDVPEGFGGDIKDYWQILHKWIVESEEYTYGEHQYLEEYITVPKKGGFHGKKLLMPIQSLK